MQQTAKYQLNLIETSDPFSPDALNKNTEAVEAALIDHETAVDAALAQQKSETDVRVTAVETAVDAGAKLVKLGSAAVTAVNSSGQTVNISLSGVSMNDYAALLLFSSATSTTQNLNVFLQINSTELGHLLSGSVSQTATGLAVVQPVGSYVAGLILYGHPADKSGNGSFGTARVSQKWANITKIGIVCGGTVQTGTFTLYGVKK